MADRSGSMVGGVLLIILGIVFLAHNFNLIPWHVWKDLWKLWPLLLVALGLKKILEK